MHTYLRRVAFKKLVERHGAAEQLGLGIAFVHKTVGQHPEPEVCVGV